MKEILDGKIGNLAKEIAIEATNDLTKDLNLDVENIDSVNDVFKELMKQPTKLISLVKNVGSKLDDKLKSGDINERELLDEASSMVNKIKDMPGMNNIQSMFSQMGVPGMGKGAKVDLNSFQQTMEKKLSSAKTRERMREKYEASKKKSEGENDLSAFLSNPMMSQMMNQINPQQMSQMSQMMNQINPQQISQMMNQINPQQMSQMSQMMNQSTPPQAGEVLNNHLMNQDKVTESTSIAVPKKKKKAKGKKK
jgi:hypothetical protein